MLRGNAAVVRTIALKEDAPGALLRVVTTLLGGGCSDSFAVGGDDDCVGGGCSPRFTSGW